MSDHVIETQVWTRDTRPGREGYLVLERNRTVREVYDDVRAVLGEYPDGGEEYFSIGPGVVRGVYDSAGTREWPVGRVVVFSITGSSEGDYVHVEVHDHNHGQERECVLLGKTFAGRDAAWAFARRLADLLGA